MVKVLALVILLIPYTLFAELELKTQNTNITLLQNYNDKNQTKEYLYNYDRLRFTLDWKDNGYFSTVIADGINYYGNKYVESELFEYQKTLRSDTPFKTQTSFMDYNGGSTYAKVYRAYGGYEDEVNRVVVGLQSITMGVGRIWNPTNLYNPKNIYALESDETYGVVGVLYTRYLDDTSHLSAIVSQNEADKFRYAMRYQGFLEVADFALDAIYSDETKMIGYEVDGSLESSGVGVRSEGAYIESNNTRFFQGLVGADYGFEEGLTLVVEALYSSKTFTAKEISENLDSEILPNLVSSPLYVALSLSSPLTIYLDASFIYIESFGGEQSRFLSPQLTYTLNDYNSFTLGVMVNDVENKKKYNGDSSTLYFRWDLAF
ncbi:hypothetical protein [Sulfurimonas marina]|uniref:Porin n=1 Tax=Sulfurimonas marina TaxID=2590551 RepID=A0A7M1AY60_9BACT|nr:hypothetical protein [Sulfurimonas marina]QOP42409.1 hypothetical protein FJR03_09810 [Sulfurimonas marina]